MKGDRFVVALFGKLPPPYIGPAIATRTLLASTLKEDFEINHFDTSDHRDARTLGRVDVGNILISIRQYFRFFFLCLQRRPDISYILNAQTTVAYIRDIPFVLMARMFRSRVVFHLRGGHFGDWYSELGLVMRGIVHVIHKRVCLQIVLGERLRSMFKGLVPDHRIVVIPNGGNYVGYEATHATDDVLHILYLGNFIPSKGIKEYILAANEIAHLYSWVNFTAAGSWQDDETRSWMMKAGNGSDSRITIVDTVNDEQKRDLMNKTDIFVFPTYYKYEGHPWVIVEAMAAGLPIITTDHAAISESVIDGVNGFLVEKHSVASIVEKMKLLIEDKTLRQTMGEASRKRYEDHFTEEIFISRIRDAFHYAMTL